MLTRQEQLRIQSTCALDISPALNELCFCSRSFLKPIIGKKGFQLHEEAWNAYPYCLTVLTNPGYMKDDFRVVLETLHLPDGGDSENVLGMPKAEYAKVTHHTANIVGDKCTVIKDISPVSASCKYRPVCSLAVY